MYGEEDQVSGSWNRWKKEGEEGAYICGLKGTTEQFLHVTKGEGLVKQKGIKSRTCIVGRSNSQTNALAVAEYDFCGTPLADLGRGVRPELENTVIFEKKKLSHTILQNGMKGKVYTKVWLAERKTRNEAGEEALSGWRQDDVTEE